MFKRVFAILLAVCICFCFTACEKPQDGLSDDLAGTSSSEPEEIKPTYYVNELTGICDLDEATAQKRPFAIMINNIDIAQPVQTGVGKADIVYETEVEGGVTRLLAVFKDTSKLEKIGTVRSARYAFIDLAMGHNAIYIHHGQDVWHAINHLNDVNRIVVEAGTAGYRVSNGLAWEHRLYADGKGIYDLAVQKGFKTTVTAPKTWQKFADEETAVSLPNAATSVTVPFSYGSKTVFNYDAATGKYIRWSGNVERKDYYTGESLYFKNVFVLNTTIRIYPNCSDGKNHREIFLTSGDGYYCVNGTYTPIKWSKGAATNGFTFTNVDGSPLEVNVGNSWVCIADATRSQPIFQ